MRKAVGTLWLCGLLASSASFAQALGERYAVDATASDFHWLVYKAGALAQRGHNHTIAVGVLSGTVWASENELASSRFELEFQVAELIVDEPGLRSALGVDFASVPTAKDIAATRSNMLSDAVLDGASYPRIRIAGAGPTMRAGEQVLAVTVELLGRSVELTVPTKVTVDAATIHATGEFELNHAVLGMKPFSIMMGALRVGETLSFSYDVTARRAAR